MPRRLTICAAALLLATSACGDSAEPPTGGVGASTTTAPVASTDSTFQSRTEGVPPIPMPQTDGTADPSGTD